MKGKNIVTAVTIVMALGLVQNLVQAQVFPATFDLSSLNGANGFRIDGVALNDNSGRVVSAAGDINGDGIDDLLIGVSNAEPNGVDSGSSYVVFGKSSGFTTTLSLSSLNGTNGFRLDGAAGVGSGSAVSAAGDVNDDGIDDLLIGAPIADLNGTDSGSSYVVFGKSSGFTATLSLSSLNGTTGFRLDGASSGDRSGSAVSAAGDINGDGIDDLLIGAPFDDPNGSNSGSSFVVFGKSTAFAATLNLNSLNGTTGFRLDGAGEYHYSGYAVSAVGDVNGDGIDDLLIGAGSADRSYVVFGKSSGFSATMNLTNLDGSNGFSLNGVAYNDGAGGSVSAAGDVNGDGIDDLLIGAVGSDLNGTNSGSSFVVFGNSSGFAATLPLSSLDGTTGFRLDGVSANDFSGQAVSAAGDVNGDGIDDLLIGAPFADLNGSESGSSYMVYGKSSGFAATLPLSSIDGTNGFRLDGVKWNDFSGKAVSGVGDVNGDGIDDLLIGADGADPNGSRSGSSYVVFGSVNPLIPGSLNFGNVFIGETSAAQSVNFKNIDTGNLDIGILSFSGINTDDFILTSDTCSNQVIAPAATCGFDIALAPLATGSRSAKVDIPSNPPSNSLSVSGNGRQIDMYVDADASPGGDGESWGTAFNNLQDALVVVIEGMEIWVAQGVYYPDVGGGQVDDDRLASFTLVDGVSVFGGFNGTETDLYQRNPELNLTILSGDITQDDANTDGNNILEDRLDVVGLNSYHIIKGIDVDTSTVFSGFTVTAGQANGVAGSDESYGAGMYCGFGFTGPSINMSTFIGNYAVNDGAGTYGCSQDVVNSDFINNYSRNGGAIRVRGGYYESVLFQGNTAYGNGGALSKSASPLEIVNSKFISNQALSGNGGAITSVNGVTLENVLFSGNKANSSGGAIYQTSSTSQLTNVTMTGNQAAATGGAIYIFNATLNLRNSIIWNNHDNTTDTTATSSINLASTTYTQTNSLVQNFGTGGVNNLDQNPLFITNTDPSTAPTLLGNAHLNVGSPAINSGDNNFILSATDIDGSTRIQDTDVDMGAYEFSSHTVSVNVTGLGAGSLVLQNNSTDDLTFNNNGTLVFSLPIVYSGEYLVTVFTQPTAPNQECIVSNASGIIDGSNVTLFVVCTTIQYSIGGTLSGLTNGTLTLQNNTGNDLQLTSDGMFEFTTQIDDLSNYAVTVQSNSSVPEQTCLVTGGSSVQNDGTGQLAGSDYTDIVVTCSVNQYSVGGTLSGLRNGTLTLQNNTGNDLQLSSNGAFVFTTQLDDLSSYAVTVKTNPIMPEQSCVVTGGDSGQNDGTGNLAGGNYTGIDVTCTALYYVDMNAPNGGDGYSWNTAFNNLQDALVIVVSGDAIWVAQGVYYPDVGGGQVDDDREASFNLRNGVSVYGGFNGTETLLSQRDPETNVTILSGDISQDDINLDGNNILEDKFGAVGSNTYQVILGTGVIDNSTFFSGFTVTAGKADGSGSRQSGAGMYCGSGTNGPSIRMSTFIGNYATSYGGATYGCSHDVRDTHFINNFTQSSGVINVRGGYYENVLFEGNFAVQKGGAISNSIGTLNIVNSKFISNKANSGGGALHSISAITLENILFSGNKSSNSSSDGGGLLLEGALTANLTNVILTGNLAPLGGAISLTSSVTLNVRNSIIWNNHGFQGEPNIDLNGGTYTQTNSLVQDFGTTGIGNLDQDPLFILETDPFTAPTTSGNAHLDVGSPAINLGDNSFVTPLLTDLDGNTRIQDTTVDMGAFEFNSYSVSVTVAGLDAGSLVLQNNGGDELTFSTDGTQIFNIPVANTADYLVSVFNQPTSPNQECVITSGNQSGNIAADVIITVECTTIQYNIGIDVSGLANGVTLSLLNNSEALNVTDNGQFNFATKLNDLTAYAVSITSQPTSPNQQCLITSGNESGNLAGSDVVVTIICTTIQYNVGVDVSGLANGVTLSLLNNSEVLDVTTDGPFNFATAIDDSTTYNVSVINQPQMPNQMCSIASGSGTLEGSDVLLTVTCTTNQYLIGGMASGLANANSVTLSLGAEDLVVISNNAFVFLNPLTDESDYSISVSSQPTVPNQICNLVNSTGTITGDDIMDIEVNCTTNQYTIGGFVTGLHSGNNLVIQNNNKDDLTLLSNGDFDFVTSIEDLVSYNVTILEQPTNPIQTCVLSSDSGNVAGEDVITVAIDCEFGDDLIYSGGFEL